MRTEADVLRALRGGSYTLEQLYALAGQRADTGRAGGQEPIASHPGDLVWKRRVRNALQTLRGSGRARRVGQSRWVIDGTPEAPTRLLLVVAGATPAEFELRLADAARLLGELDGPADLILCDPPWGLGRGEGRHYADGNGYRRDCSNIVGGYQDVEPERYADFTRQWVSAAAAALRDGGQLATVTGPQRAAHVQVAAEEAGLTWVTSIAARKTFPLATLRRPASSHWVIGVMTRGRLDNPRRVFNPPEDQPRARSGHPYPLDWWAEGNGRADRPGLVRYDNALPLPLVLRCVRAFSDPGEHVADPFLGSGTTGVACWLAGRRFTGGDINPAAVRFAAARLLTEHIHPAEAQPALFATA